AAVSPPRGAGATPGGRPLPGGASSSRTADAVWLPRDLHHLVVLDHVAFLDVVEVLQPDAALVAGRHGPDVVLEAAQRLDATVVDDHAVADQPGLGAADHLPAGDVRAGDHPDPRHPEQGPHLGAAQRALLVLGREHALERALDVLHHLVDDRVEADVDALAVGQRGGGRVGPHREADDD